MRIAVIGAGVVGLAAAHALSRRNAQVHVFDQHKTGHDLGASHGESRLIRLAYFEHPGYVPLLRRAYAGWRALESEWRESVFQRTGLLEIGPAESALISGVERTAEAFDLPLSTLSRDEIAEHCAGLNVPSNWRALYEKDAGYLLADRALAAFHRSAEETGAAFHWNERVTGLEVAVASLTLVCDAGRHEFDRIVIAPGPWADKTFAALGLAGPCPITPIAKTHCWFSLRNGAVCKTPLALEDNSGAFFYAIPAPDGRSVKLGAHYGGACMRDPDDDRPDLAGEASIIADFARQRLPGLAPEIMRRTECLYEMSPDKHFVIDSAVEDARISYAIGLSGHGFKFAPAIGELLADMALDNAHCDDAFFLSAARF